MTLVSRKKRAFALALTATLTAGTFVVPQAVAVEAEGQLSWGIRTSFNNYVRGYTKIGEGATFREIDGVDNYDFELESQKYDAANKRLEAQFKGQIIFKQYCEGQKGNDREYKLNHWCALDLTFENPKVVLDDDQESYLEATVKSRQYLTKEFYAPEGPVRVADLYPQAATFSQKDGVVNWSEIPATITEEGNLMMSEFYTAGDGMDPVNLTYKGEADDITSKDALRTHPKFWISPAYYARLTRMFDTGDNLIASVAGEGLHLLRADLGEIAKLDANLDKYGAGAYDAKNKLFYYAEDGSDELKSVLVTSAGFETPQVVASGHGNISAVAVHPDTGVVVAIAQDKSPNETDMLGTEQPASMISIIDGKVNYVTLPTTKELFEVDLDPASSPAYREVNYKPQISELLPMDDGTFIFVPLPSIYRLGEGNSIHGFMLSVLPTATTGKEAVKFMPGAEHDSTLYYDNVITDGSRIVRVNSNAKEGEAFGELLDYKDRDATIKVSRHPLNGFEGWAGGTFDADGNVMMMSDRHSKLVWFDPETFNLIEKDGEPKEAAVPNGRETAQYTNGELIRREDGTVYAPSLVRIKDGNEHLKVRRLINLKTFKPSPNSSASAEELKKKAAVELAESAVKQAKQELEDAKSAGDAAAIKAAEENLSRAEAGLKAAKCALDVTLNCGADEPDPSDNTGDVTDPDGDSNSGPDTDSTSDTDSNSGSDTDSTSDTDSNSGSDTNTGANDSTPTDEPKVPSKPNGKKEQSSKDLAIGLGVPLGIIGVLGVIAALIFGPLKPVILSSPLRDVFSKFLR